MLRGEKKARLMEAYNKLPEHLQAHGLACEGKLEALMGGSVSPDAIALPPLSLRR